MSFECKRCGHTTKNKANLLSHLQNKKPCVVTQDDVPRETLIEELTFKVRLRATISCSSCKKIISKAHVARHKKVCKGQKQSFENQDSSEDTEVTKEEFLKLKAELEQLKQQIASSQASTSGVINNTTNNNNTQNNTNNININIQLNNFGQENTSYLTPEFLTYCLSNPKKGMASLIEQIHYNKDFPENHNLRCKSLKKNIFEKFVDTQWTLCDASNTLDELIKKGYRILETHFAEQFSNDPEFFDDEDRAEAIQRFRYVLTEKTSQDYHAVKRDIRLLIKDKTMYLLELVAEIPQIE
jgi:hypothetical protein